jgi:uncharacterized YigZ family protein
MKKIMVPAGSYESEFTEKKSRFISRLYPVDDDHEVKSLLRELRKDHPESRHVVWSYVLGDGGTLYGLSDDGEPHGTAGRPVLEVLKGSGLTYAALFVIRYFGGIKLGTGGLVSAYTRAAQEVLALAESVERIERIPVALSCTYSQFERIRSVLLERDLKDLKEEFSDAVVLEGDLPLREFEDCYREILDMSSGAVELIKMD